ncbi:MAG: hypothetical protein WBN75_15450 [Verrucomicrobiia bacterium]
MSHKSVRRIMRLFVVAMKKTENCKLLGLTPFGAVNTPLTVNRAGANANRATALQGLQKIPGYDLDEAPPAMLRKSGDPVVVRPTPPADNRGAGASLGNQAKGVPEGGQVIIQIQKKPAND